MNDHEITTLLDRAGSELRPDVADLVAGGAAKGRATRRRRRVGSALVAVAAAGVVGVAAALLLPGGGGGAAPVATDPTTVSSPAATSPRQMAPDPGKTGEMLANLLPAGHVTSVRSWTDDPDRYRAGGLLLSGAQVQVIIERTKLPRCGEQPAETACDSVGDGFASTATYEEPASGGGPSGIVQNTATLFTSDHFSVTVTSWNAPGEKHVDPVSAQPALTTQQLLRIARNPVWFEDQQ